MALETPSNSNLKRISVSEVRLGMHLHGMDGPWLSHPFWRARFVLTERSELEKLRSSGVAFCWIDTDKGVDVDAPPPPAPAAASGLPPAAVAAPAVPSPAPAKRPAQAQVSMAAEMDRAAAVIERSKTAVQSLLREARLGRTLDATPCVALVDDITASVFRNPGALVSLSRLKTHDDYSYMHSVAVCGLMVALARELGMGEAACREAGMAGMLHDVGKAAMPLEVLNKPARLSDVEMALMRSHPERGHEMLSEARGAGADALEVCLHHHERVDGAGYPHRLAGEAVSRLARMGAVCDVYDAITSNRPYKAGWDPAIAIAQMASWKGQFDPAILAIFVKTLGIYPVGSLVRLESGRLAVVIEHNPLALHAPQVRVFFSTRSNLPIPTETIDLARDTTADRIVGREPRERWGFTQLEAVWSQKT